MELDGVDSWNLKQVREMRSIAKQLLAVNGNTLKANMEFEETARVLLRKGFKVYRQANQGHDYNGPFLIASHDAESIKDPAHRYWPVVIEGSTLVGFHSTV